MDFSEFIHYLPSRFIDGVQFEGTRYVLGTIGVFLLVWVFLGPLLKNRRIRERKPYGAQVKMELKNSLRSILVFVALDIVIYELAARDIFRFYSDISNHSMLYFWATIAIGIIGHDTYFYWSHRAMHTARLYKATHLTHHRSHNPTPFTAYSFSPLEAVIEYMYFPLLAATLPMHPTAVAMVLGIQIVKNAVGHCGYEIYPSFTLRTPVLNWMTTVTHHDMHHERGTGNFGLYFTLWDKWMGTEHAHYEERFNQAVAKPKALTA